MEDNKNKAPVPFYVYEASVAKSERTEKRLIIALVIVIFLLFVSNVIWLWAWNQYDYVAEETSETYQQDGSGYNNINTGTQGDITNGADIQKKDSKTIPNEEKWENERNEE